MAPSADVYSPAGAVLSTVGASALTVGNADAAIGDNFSFAPTTVNPGAPNESKAPAYPGGTAFWAGVCDLFAGPAATLAQPPADRRFPGCIEQEPSLATDGGLSTQMAPPLAPGVTPNLDIPNDGVGFDDGSGADGWVYNDDLLTPVAGPDWRLADVTQAAGRPDGSASFWFARSPDRPKGLGPFYWFGPDGQPRDVRVSLPPGVVGNPNAVPKCPLSALQVSPSVCPPKTQVGVSTLSVSDVTAVYPVYNVEPRRGKTAEFIISGIGVGDAYKTNAPIIASARTSGDFGVDAFASDAPSAVGLHGQTFTFWAVPWAKSHDIYRPVAGYCGAPTNPDTNISNSGGMEVDGLQGGTGRGCSQEPQSYDPSWGPIKPFFATQTECSPTNPVTKIRATNWHTPVVAEAQSVAPNITGCGDVVFDASLALGTTSSTADSPSGIDATLTMPQNNEPPQSLRFNPCDAVGPGCAAAGAPAHWKSTAGLARAHLKDTLVTLLEGYSLNPSAATGLRGCSDAAIGVRDASTDPVLFNDDDPFDGAGPVECPQESVIGTAEAITPLLTEKLTGEIVLGTPKSTDPTSGQMLRTFLVLRNRDRGLIAKIFGTATADPATGQLKATFAKNPQVPVDKIELHFKSGSRGLIATPQRCVTGNWNATMTPWTGGANETSTGEFVTNQRCAFGFDPKLDAGMSSRAARGSGVFSFRFTREDGEQWAEGLTAQLPQGLLATVRDVPLCTSAEAAAGGCPAASRIGTVDASAGVGDPWILEEKGDVFLTEGYKGGQYGLLVKVRGVAGPFRDGQELSPIVVRQALHVDRTTARVTAISDPFPLIHHGVPLRVRSVNVLVDRGGFMVNPSDCSPKQIGADIVSVEGTVASLSNHFQASGCAALPFRPRLALTLSGRKQATTGKHPGIRAQVNQTGIGEAGIKKAEVRLPKSLALDVDNAQALCEYADGTKDDLENHCPKGSIVGRARAVSPLLNRDLVGNVYFVKNIRRDPKTGNEIRTLPMIIVALRGEVAINLRGESSTTKAGKLVNTFASVPDAPITRFNLNIAGGKNGILAVTRTRRALINLCAKPKSHVAEADMDGQNGRRFDRDVRMKTPCTKRQTKAAKRQAKRAAAKRAAVRRG